MDIEGKSGCKQHLESNLEYLATVYKQIILKIPRLAPLHFQLTLLYSSRKKDLYIVVHLLNILIKRENPEQWHLISTASLSTTSYFQQVEDSLLKFQAICGATRLVILQIYCAPRCRRRKVDLVLRQGILILCNPIPQRVGVIRGNNGDLWKK